MRAEPHQGFAPPPTVPLLPPVPGQLLHKLVQLGERKPLRRNALMRNPEQCQRQVRNRKITAVCWHRAKRKLAEVQASSAQAQHCTVTSPGQCWSHQPWKCSKNSWRQHFERWFSGHRGIWTKVGMDDLLEGFSSFSESVLWLCLLTGSACCGLGAGRAGRTHTGLATLAISCTEHPALELHRQHSQADPGLGIAGREVGDGRGWGLPL